MRKKLFSLTLVILLLIILFNLFYNSLEINNIISYSISLFIKNVFPSLFPMFVISSLLVAIGTPKFLGNVFNKLMFKVFKVKGEGSFVFFMSMISGFPSSAKFIKELLDKKLITEIDANKILTFTFFSNPLFIINTIGIMFLNSKELGFIILLSHILGNFITGLLFRNLYIDNLKYNKINIKQSLKTFHNDINNTDIFKELLNGISNSLKTLINIFGIITCFLIIVLIIETNIKISPISNSILTGLLELTSGVKSVSTLDISLKLKIYLSTFFISFGGFSVHAQIFNVLENYKIKYFPFFLSRIIHGCISVLLVYFFINL